jgi:sugar phosphate isomerase/epimerase
MYFTGFADEAAKDLDGQIRATKELGWNAIESRAIDGMNIHDLPDDQFDVVVEKLAAADVRINCFGSAIANWAKQITDPIHSSLEETKRAIPRMQRLGTRLVRIMSFAVLEGRGADDQMKEERFKRVRRLTDLFLDAGLVPVHENCMNYGGMGWTCTLELLENVPGLKLVFDTGNPVFTDDRTKDKPYPKQSAWEFYEHVRDHIAYVHIKDGIWMPDTQTTDYTYPGEGDGDVRRIMTDLIGRGYDGGISIEPHIGAVFHDPSVQAEDEKMYRMYVEYGKRMMRMVDEIKAELKR